MDAIEGASNSPYSHCDLVSLKDNQWVVIEAIGPVRETPLFSYIRRGRDSFFEVYRPKAAYQPKISELITAARQYLGRPYDIRYQLDDGKIYCSELLWKAWLTTNGTRLAEPVPLGNLHWQPHEALIRRIEHGGRPLEREIITPRAVAESEMLERVFDFRSASLPRSS